VAKQWKCGQRVFKNILAFLKHVPFTLEELNSLIFCWTFLESSLIPSKKKSLVCSVADPDPEISPPNPDPDPDPALVV
jgi:hypothetical protein